MTIEMILMKKEDYHEILHKIVAIKSLIDSKNEIGVEGGIISIEYDLLEKAAPCEVEKNIDEPVTANDMLKNQLNILIDSTTAAADDALKALNILNGDE